MKEYKFEKNINYECNVDEVNDVVISNDFKYENNDDGINIKGDIIFNYSILKNEERIKEEHKLPVDLFVSLNEIDSLKDITLEIDNFDYMCKDNCINFNVLTKLKGNKEDFIFFELTPNKKINDLAVSLLMRDKKNEDNRNILSKEQIENIKELIKTNSVDLISTSFEDIKDVDDIIEITSFNNEELLTSRENNDETKVEIKEEIDNVIDKNEVKKVEINEDKSILKETYTCKYFYYVIKENETKNDILNRFGVSEEEFDKYNKFVEIKKGNLIRIIR